MKTFLGHSVFRQLSSIFLFLLLILAASPSLANDTAAVVAAGGIQFRHEPRISMEKERLFISEKKVTVDYDFLNQSDQDIKTEIAFPVPPFNCKGYCAGGGQTISDFHVWVDQKEVPYLRNVKATLNGHEYSDELQKLGIDIATFGHVDLGSNFEHSETYQVDHLSPEEVQHLIALGLVSRDRRDPLWTVEEIYHWTQTFPARRRIHIRHEYPPAVGYDHVYVEDLDEDTRKDKVAEALARPKGSPGSDSDDHWLPIAKEVDNLCVDSSLARKIKEAESLEWKARVEKNGAPPSPIQVDDLNVNVLWVEYILSTANSWKGPIKDFTLLVERPVPEGEGKRQSFVSFCWDSPVRRVDENHFEAHVTNFVPRKELNVGFFTPDP